MLQCPACQGALSWEIFEREAGRIEAAMARCNACDAAYPVRDGIGLFLTPDLPRNDLWEEVESGLTQYLRANPETKSALMDVELRTLAPADQFFRAMMLESLGKFTQAKAALELSMSQLYSEAQTACLQSQYDYVTEQLAGAGGPIVDLASGRGGLIEVLAQRLTQPLILTDFSPRVLRDNRRRFEFEGLYHRMSMLSFDARRTPFKEGALLNVTTNQGLPNIQEPGELLHELRRVVSGAFFAVSHFYPEDDAANAAALRERGLEVFLFRERALAGFEAAGWAVEIANACTAEAKPTPAAKVLEGAQIDVFPVAPTTLEWCVLVAR
jgi:uncharacterized protein YbaR (Trm112 family)